MSSAPASGAIAPAHSFGLDSSDVLPVVITLAAVASGLSGQQPTGNSVADFVLSAVFGGGLAWLSRWATPHSLLTSAVIALFFTGFDLPFVLVAVVATASAVFVTSWRTLDTESHLIGAAVTAALVGQVVLNLPGITWFDLPGIRWVGSASVLALCASAPIIWTAWRGAPARYRSTAYWVGAVAIVFAIVSGVLALWAALSVRNSIEVGIDQAQQGVAALEGGEQDAAIALLRASQQNFENARGRLEGPLTWPGRFVPIVAQHSRALETAADQGAVLARSAVRVVETADVDRIRGNNGAIDLDLVGQVNAELSSANAILQRAQRSLADVQTPWLLPQVARRLDEVQVELAATNENIDLANHATAVVPGLLGADTPRRYLVLFVQPAESREFGGFVGAYGILEADAGQLSLSESGSISPELGSGEASFTNPEEFPQSYLTQRVEQNPQNLTGIADLPTIAAAARDLVPQWRGDADFTIDGVITIDPYALAAMLELTGPISISSDPGIVSSETVVEFLLRDQYSEFDDEGPEERKDALEELAGAGFRRLLEIELPGPEQLGAIFGPVARANRIGFVTYDDNENLFLERIFLTDAMPVVGEFVEMIGVHGATGIASKLDGYSTRSMTYTVTVDPGSGVVTGEMDIVITNEVPDDASGYITGGVVEDNTSATPSGKPLEVGDNLLAVSIYTRSALAEVLSPDADFTTFESTPALGYDRTVIVVEVPRQTAKHITFQTRSQVGPGRYDVLLLAQQTANIGDLTLIVRPTPGWRVVSDTTAADGSWTSTTPLDMSRGFSLVFEKAD